MRSTITVAIARLRTIADAALTQSPDATEAQVLEVCALLDGALTGRPVPVRAPPTPGVTVTRPPRNGETITLRTNLSGPGFACVSSLGTSDVLATSTDPRALVRWVHRFENSTVMEPGVLAALEGR